MTEALPPGAADNAAVAGKSGYASVQRVEPLGREVAHVVDSNSLSISELVRSASYGVLGAWRELLDRFGQMIAAIGRSHALVPKEIDQLQQTTWLLLLESFDRIGDPERVGGWLAATARLESRQMLRRLAS